MDDKLKQLTENLKSIRLTPEEKQDLKRALLINVSGMVPRFSFWKRYQLAASLGLVIVMLGTTLSWAAEGALPGEILYPIKTKINEPVVTLLSPKKAERQVRIVEKRLDEAEKLDREGKLTEPLKSTIKETIVKQAAKTIEKEKKNNKREEKKIEAVVEKHEQILEKLEIVDKKSKNHDKIKSERNDDTGRQLPMQGSGIKSKNNHNNKDEKNNH